MPLEASLSIARQVASALSQVHEKGLAHGDVKAGNVLVSAERGPGGDEELVAKLIDFGRSEPLSGYSPLSTCPSDHPGGPNTAV
jgi:serine/threonine protein kinase